MDMLVTFTAQPVCIDRSNIAMITDARYWQMVILTSNGQYQLKDIPQARRWLQAQFAHDSPSQSIENKHLQGSLWEIWTAQSEGASLAHVCLRCWLSHQILRVCQQLGSRFGATYGFIASELWPFVLEDDGQIESTYPSFSQKILKKYDPTQATLSTWATRMTKSHPGIKQFCLERGLYFISDWAILNDTTPRQLSRLLIGLSEGAIAQKMTLLSSYHHVYRLERILQRQRQGKSCRCQEPTTEQLRKINPKLPPTQVLNQLYELASQLRQYRISVRRGMPISQSLDLGEEGSYFNMSAECKDDDEQAQDDFLDGYRNSFLTSLDNAIQTVILSYTHKYQRKDPPKDHIYLLAMTLFHCEGLSMSAIAPKVQLSTQVQVTRLLNLKRFRTEVCASWFNQLKQQVNTEALAHISPQRLNNLSGQIDQILIEETETAMASAAAEAQMPKNRTANSIFSRRLCDLLPSIQPS